MTTFFHADDYGITKQQTKHILSLSQHGIRKGLLNSVSVMPNTPYTKEAVSSLKDTGIRKVVHLNFIEGKSVHPSEELPLLTNENGMLRCTFSYLLKLNFASRTKKKQVKEQLKKEILAQIRVVYDSETDICIDSHQHFHMIPLVLSALYEVVTEQGYHVSMLRVPTDPLLPLFKHPSFILKLRPVDVLKWMILSILKWMDHSLLQKFSSDIPVFFGIFFTCRMYPSIVEKLLLDYQSIAEKKGKSLELMLHPGAVSDQSDLLDASNEQLVTFYASNDRALESETFLYLSEHES